MHYRNESHPVHFHPKHASFGNRQYHLLVNDAMLLVDLVPDLKASFAGKAMGIAGLQPRLVRGLPL